MTQRPNAAEAPSDYGPYFDRVPDGDIVRTLETQLDDLLGLVRPVSEEESLYRYAPGKWSLRQLLCHVSDDERIAAFRALWFARGVDAPLPGFDSELVAGAAGADGIPWARHVEELQTVRLATLSLFRNLPAEAWAKKGIANDNPFTVRALAWFIAGHADHHAAVIRERYLRHPGNPPKV